MDKSHYVYAEIFDVCVDYSVAVNEICPFVIKCRYNDPETGKEIIPEEPNSYKFESFIFDAFEFFDEMALLRVKREDEFAPVKNREGSDSPKTAKELYEKYWNRQRQ